MADKPGKIKPKRLSKSERTHRRRLKQAARKSANASSEPTNVSRLVKTQETTR